MVSSAGPSRSTEPTRRQPSARELHHSCQPEGVELLMRGGSINYNVGVFSNNQCGAYQVRH